MPSFGRNPYPRRFGGGKAALEIEHEALLDALAPGWDDAADTASYAELYAWALALSMIWAVNGRLRAEANPATMLTTLPTWELALRVPPTRSDTTQQRRARVAAKLRGIAGNALSDITATCSAAAGSSVVRIDVPDLAHVWTYWPGVNPGPPGLDWASNRASITVVLTRVGIADADFFLLLETLSQSLDAMIPSWLQFNIGTDDGGFVCSVGTLGVSLLGGA